MVFARFYMRQYVVAEGADIDMRYHLLRFLFAEQAVEHGLLRLSEAHLVIVALHGSRQFFGATEGEQVRFLLLLGAVDIGLFA